ncbi:hypothetical protein FBD94_16845 [Pedobacter hiemivivus]|uniref:DUF676 domain-containing protein n=1 Tax=Pedobacter hiemivivus TaxID=2530454 RepID=A0A4U1G8L3_9SPHI|nr:hypothetical protein [Pedobacter hiemivivus]TKC59199.1 hypothetical protein FBD94_16845 [Pedobacter hiemivivus]
MTEEEKKRQIIAPYYPIIYVRGYAMTSDEREETFNDAYYGFSASSVEKRQATKANGYEVADIFEGQMIRFMKIKDYGYADSVNYGLRDFHGAPSRSIWVCRFYDVDYIKGKVREIEAHAEDLAKMILVDIPKRLKEHNVTNIETEYKVILIAHSMGGLVCRTLIQNILQSTGAQLREKYPDSILGNLLDNPLDLIHKLVTIGTPHKGIDMGNIPDFIEKSIVSLLNPFDAGIFHEKRMRDYLKLPQTTEFDVNSLGNSGFPIERCLCIIGSDYNSYGKVRYATGGFSDGLVKQDAAYIVAGPAPEKDKGYDEKKVAYYANVHRAHSGYRGIVNSYETYENIQRFLFGNLMVRISLGDIKFTDPVIENLEYFYDFEFSLSIRGTGVYLHRREQDPCENAIRFNRDDIPHDIHLHTGFLNSSLQLGDDGYSYFILKFNILEYRIEPGFIWDYKYPSRQIYADSMEVKVDTGKDGNYKAAYRWFSEIGWNDLVTDENNRYTLPLKQGVIDGTIRIEAAPWGEKLE